MNKLKIRLTVKDNPYKEEFDAFSEAWGEVSVEISDISNVQILARIQWDVYGLLEWFVQNQQDIVSKELFVLGEQAELGESISQAMYRIRMERFLDPQEEDAVLDEWARTYDSCYEQHSLVAGIRGSKMDDILIGLNRGVGEVSLLNTTQDWKYEFDMGSFVQEFHRDIRQFAAQSIKSAPFPRVMERARYILEHLGDP